jgi:uncharacterized protein YkwD
MTTLPPSLVLASSLLLSAAATGGTADTKAARQLVLKLCNDFRTSQKAEALSPNEKLARAAQGVAEELAKQDKLAPYDKAITALLTKEGYRVRTWQANVGRLEADDLKELSERIVAHWQKTPELRKNLLAGHTEGGIGMAKGKSGNWYVLLILATPR